ncbi:unnamed protein product, partial [Cyprideis torosa]
MGRKKEKNSSLGQTLIKDSHKRGARQLHPKGKGDENLLHSANLQDGADWNRLNLRSVTEAGPIEEFLAVADLADSDFTAERRNVTLVSSTTAFQQLLTERVKSEKIRRSHSSLVRIPRRPFWESNTTPDELVKLEKEAFLEWRRSLATLADEEGACLTPYEKNLEFWRQLWRVVERSDVVVQILDARNPLLFRCPDLEKYVREVKSSKMNVLLLNKADFLTYSQRRSWAEWFQSEGMKVIFYSAVSTPAPISAGEESSSVNDVSEEPLNVAETVEEDGRVSQDGDDDDWETCSSSSSEEESAGTGEKSQSKKLTFASSESVRNSAECLNPDELAVLLEGLHKGSKERPGITTIGLVGYPNVGKSSTINSLLKAKKTATSITPGKTKHFQTHFLTPSLLLCDCPGLVFPSLVSTKADLVLNGILPVDSLRDHVAPTTLLIERIPSPVLEKTYGLQLPVMPSNAELMIKQPDLTSEELLNAYGGKASLCRIRSGMIMNPPSLPNMPRGIPGKRPVRPGLHHETRAPPSFTSLTDDGVSAARRPRIEIQARQEVLPPPGERSSRQAEETVATNLEEMIAAAVTRGVSAAMERVMASAAGGSAATAERTSLIRGESMGRNASLGQENATPPVAVQPAEGNEGPEVVPAVLFVEQEIRNNIQEGGFIKISSLLPTSRDTPKDGPMGFRTWMEGFGMFGSIYLERYPDEGVGLMKYASDLAAYAGPEHPPGAFFYYDEAFRRARSQAVSANFSTDEYQWGKFRPDLWAYAVRIAQRVSPRREGNFGGRSRQATRPGFVGTTGSTMIGCYPWDAGPHAPHFKGSVIASSKSPGKWSRGGGYGTF